MLKKTIAAIIIVSLFFAAVDLGWGAKRKKKTSYRWRSYSGPRPVFPVSGSTVTPPPPPPLLATTPVTTESFSPRPKEPLLKAIIPKVGLAGEGLQLGFDATYGPVTEGLSLSGGWGSNLSSNTSLSLGGIFKVNQNFSVGASLDLGPSLGIGVFGLTNWERWQLRLGYSSSLKLTASAGYILEIK